MLAGAQQTAPNVSSDCLCCKVIQNVKCCVSTSGWVYSRGSHCEFCWQYIQRGHLGQLVVHSAASFLIKKNSCTQTRSVADHTSRTNPSPSLTSVPSFYFLPTCIAHEHVNCPASFTATLYGATTVFFLLLSRQQCSASSPRLNFWSLIQLLDEQEQMNSAIQTHSLFEASDTVL